MKAMCLTRFATVVLLSGFVCTSGLVRAQSLGDVAKKEEERRKVVGPAGKIYTNKDLPSVPQPSTTSVPGEPATLAARPEAPKDQPSDAKDKDPKDKPVVKDQAYWAERKKTLQGQLERDQTVSDALQSRIN